MVNIQVILHEYQAVSLKIQSGFSDFRRITELLAGLAILQAGTQTTIVVFNGRTALFIQKLLQDTDDPKHPA